MKYGQHKPHSMVDVYQDPLTRQDLEGRAEVICREPEYGHTDPGYCWYLVRFKGTPGSESVHRLLKEPVPCIYCDGSGINPAYQPPRFLDEGETYNVPNQCPDCDGKGWK